ncbi:cysteine peptidase family C39 domain-containing protein [Ligilactobacillus murinus]|jgi:ATP-binding cassette subfamily C protein/competence factor transporting protein|uniref:cysteine peptidase family C39 domain-containing protein n=1 Tax=Ligilactobacillus murinus TaxID=1622 RepID=UPI0009D9E336|nr:hypothetical protein [Ligilactobacillus murinus]
MISQIDESDCGVASLAMLLKYYGSDVSLSYLRNIAKTDKDGTTIKSQRNDFRCLLR